MADSLDDVLGDIFWLLEHEPEELGPADEVDGYFIHTSFIRGYWETAVWKEGSAMAIVSRYVSKEKAKLGHAYWCALCISHPTKIWDIQSDKYIEF